MSDSMFTFVAIALSLVFFGGVLLSIEVGWRLAHRELKQGDDLEGTKPIEAALFGLLGLLLAFTFSGAASRFDSRRLLVVEETNIIGTAYLRLDLLPSASSSELKKMMRDYLDLRIETFRHLSDTALRSANMAATQKLQNKIWEGAVAAARKDPFTPSAVLILPALNEMIDITTTRSMWTLMHPPMIIFFLLVGIGLACAVVAGYGLVKGANRRWVHILGFAFVLAFTFYVILDLEFPRLGFIRVDSFDQAMADLRAGMK